MPTLLLGFIFLSCKSDIEQINTNQLPIIEGYDLNNPDVMVSLPSILKEVSGLTDVDAHTVACVQDEEGQVFIYNIQDNEIKNQFKFAGAGDYEGITRVENTLYIMRSDAHLFEIDNYLDKDFKVKEYQVNIPAMNNEGLAYDPMRNRLLIACKSESNEKKYKDERLVFAFDLKTKSISDNPVYNFNKAQMQRFVDTNQPTVSKKGKKKNLSINPSGISVHPITGMVYVLSSKGAMLYIFDQESNLVAFHPLDRKTFSQPEGITFLKNGDMFISNEGRKGNANLMKFKYKNGNQ